MTTKKYASLEQVPSQIRTQLANYFSNLDSDTFSIANLPPQMTGALLARYSRVPHSIRLTLINEFLDDQGNLDTLHANQLVDRVLNAFGDDSVGELERGIIVGFEGASNLLTKEIEDRRIGGSPIEQSSRYVKYDKKDRNGKWSYLRPTEVAQAGMMPAFEKANDAAFEVYSASIEPLMEHFRGQLPRDKYKIKVKRNSNEVEVAETELVSEDEKREFNNAYTFTVRCAALDVARGLLPTSTTTQLGLSGNARFYTNLITHLKSSELAEARNRGYALEAELQKIIPDFIKRNKEDPQIRERNQKMRELSDRLFGTLTTPSSKQVTLVQRADFEAELIANILYPSTRIPLNELIDEVKFFSSERKIQILEEYAGARTSRRSRTGRAVEAGYPFTYDIVGTFAEFRDLERHRMLTQQRQLLGTDLGFAIPEELRIIDFEERTAEVVEEMEKLNRQLKEKGLEVQSQYASLFNHQLRFSMGMNLRELQHLSELRSQKQGHYGYRKIAMDMATEAIAREPLSSRFLGFVDYSDPENKIARAREQAIIAGKNIRKGIDGGTDLKWHEEN